MEIQNYKECLSYLQYSFKNIQNGLECSSNLFPLGPVRSKCCNNAMVCYEAKFCPLVVSNFYDNTRQGTSNVFRPLRQRIVDKPFFHRAGGRFLTNQEQRKGFKEQQGINRSPSNSWQGQDWWSDWPRATGRPTSQIYSHRWNLTNLCWLSRQTQQTTEGCSNINNQCFRNDMEG